MSFGDILLEQLVVFYTVSERMIIWVSCRHGPKPGCQEAEAEAFSILEAEAEALTLFKLEAEAEALVTKPKPKPGYL